VARKLFGIEIEGILSEDVTAAWVKRACERHLSYYGSATVHDLTPEWVSVEDEARLPKDGRDVWAFAADGEVGTGYWVAPECWLAPSGCTIDGVTHWQERIVPDPPCNPSST